jgi:hypothetical protein
VTRLRPIQTATDAQLLDDLDALVADAALGRTSAVGVIAIAFAPLLLAEIRAALGRHLADDAGHVLHRFHGALLAGGLAFPRIRGAAIPWMKRTVRAMARQHRRAAQTTPPIVA